MTDSPPTEVDPILSRVSVERLAEFILLCLQAVAAWDQYKMN